VPQIRIPSVKVQQRSLIRFFDDTGKVRELLNLRLLVSIYIGKTNAPKSLAIERRFSAVLDTGAPISVFPKATWRNFASEIKRVPLVEERVLSSAAGGRRFNYILGRVWVGAVDLWDRQLPPIPVLAQFREDDIPEGEPQPPTLLGLWGGILEGRTLTRWPVTERFDADIPTLESYGQW
jgi:hypothetical protein